MGNGLSYRVETTKGSRDVGAVGKDGSKRLAPIVAARNYNSQIHKVSVVNGGVNWSSALAIFLLASHPSFANFLWHPLLDPF